ncbi:MAG: LSU ribosomal protein L5p (L11e), partial [uncultured Actinomycetospora sp.]
DHHRSSRDDPPAAAAALPGRDQGRADRAVRVREPDARPRRRQGRREHGRRRGRARLQADGGRGPRPHPHRRAEARDPPGPQVDRPVQAARGHAHRRPRHAARRAHVGVPRPAADHRPAAHPRLPRPVAQAVRRPGQLHVRSVGPDDVPRDRPGLDRPAARDGHHRGHLRDDRRGGPGAAPSARLPVQGEL